MVFPIYFVLNRCSISISHVYVPPLNFPFILIVHDTLLEMPSGSVRPGDLFGFVSQGLEPGAEREQELMELELLNMASLYHPKSHCLYKANHEHSLMNHDMSPNAI